MTLPILRMVRASPFALVTLYLLLIGIYWWMAGLVALAGAIVVLLGWRSFWASALGFIALALGGLVAAIDLSCRLGSTCM